MEQKAFWSERIAFAVIAALSVLIMFLSSAYGIGTPVKPGPGMYPFVIGLLILPLSLLLFIQSWKSWQGKRDDASVMSLRQARTFFLFVGACAFWILAMPLLGYPLVTLIVVFLLGKLMALEGWWRPLGLAAGTALFIYLLFDVWLYIDLPRGIWG